MLGDAWRALDKPLPCPMWPGWEGPVEVPKNFVWDGNSSGLFAPVYPTWNHPISSCRHDWRCLLAKTPEERLWADRAFRDDVGTTSWWVTKQIGYLGVRLGALLGIGVRYAEGGHGG